MNTHPSKPFLPGDIIQFLPDEDDPLMLVIDAGEMWGDEKRRLNLVNISTIDMGRTKVLPRQVNPELFRVVAR
jgi:hypothetical protein